MNWPKIGLRTIKTSLAVAITAGVMTYIFKQTPFFACIGAVVGVGRTKRSSFEDALIRNLGTFVGGFIGMAMIFISDNVFFEALGVIPIIYINNNILKKPASIVPACIVYFAVVYLSANDAGHLYALTRIAFTLLGTCIGLLVNFLIRAPEEA